MPNGTRRNMIEREILLVQVERNVLKGLDTPGKLLSEMSELGSQATARRHLQAVMARWEAQGQPESLGKARLEMISNAINMRETAWQQAQECESHTARVQYLRLVDKAIEREMKLRGCGEEKSERPGSTSQSGDEWEKLPFAEVLHRLTKLENQLDIKCNEPKSSETIPGGTTGADSPKD